MVFGITEAGDASINYEWVEKMETVDGVILITKNLTDKFIETVLSMKEKPIIIHASCTGYGQTILEPHIPTYKETLTRIKFLINQGFLPERIVLRVDPIISTEKGLKIFQNVIISAREIIPEVTRIRISVMDMYPHVRQRFQAVHAPVLYHGNFQASDKDFEQLNIVIRDLLTLYPEIKIESCAETKLPNAIRSGCVSQRDFEILHLPYSTMELKGNRKNCLCVCAKKELLTFKYNQTGYNHCYGCLYCYWKTES